MIIINLLKQRTQTPERLILFKRCSERSFAMYLCTDDLSKSFETENANASAFKSFLNVSLECSFAMYFCTDDHSKSIETENANANAFKKFFLNVALTRSFAMY